VKEINLSGNVIPLTPGSSRDQQKMRCIKHLMFCMPTSIFNQGHLQVMLLEYFQHGLLGLVSVRTVNVQLVCPAV